MTKKVELFSGKVLKVTGEDLSPGRYKWLKLSEAEPDLGTATVDGSLLIGNTDNTREWSPDVFLTYPTNPNTGNPTPTLNIAGNLQVDGNINGIIQVDVTPASVSLPDGAGIKIGNDVVLTQRYLGDTVTQSNLQKVGTVTTGVWEATPIATPYGGTGIGNPNGITPNAVLYGNGPNPMRETNVGDSGQILQINTTNGNPIFDVLDGGGWSV